MPAEQQKKKGKKFYMCKILKNVNHIFLLIFCVLNKTWYGYYLTVLKFMETVGKIVICVLFQRQVSYPWNQINCKMLFFICKVKIFKKLFLIIQEICT